MVRRTGQEVRLRSHLEDYLAYYKTVDNPSYAVLVTGEWGVGKTHQVLDFFEDREIYYVSLFGLQNTEAVHNAVLAASAPTQAKILQLLNRASATSKDIGGLAALGGLAPSLFQAIMRQQIDASRTVIFDDLERSGLGLKELLGVINEYVEQRKCRVVVIAHDDRVAFESDHSLPPEPKIAEAAKRMVAHILRLIVIYGYS